MSLSREQHDQLKRAVARWSAPCEIAGVAHSSTPYTSGLCFPGRGVDCVRFGDALLQETYYGAWNGLAPLPREAQDSAWHSVEVVNSMTRLMFERFDLFSVSKAKRRLLKPADFITVRQKIPNRGNSLAEQRPHHVLVVGPNPQWCWHAAPRAHVAKLGIGGVRACFDIVAVWRSRMGYEA